MQPGKLLDTYRIERELGRGGQSVVYLARDERHDRDVVLKILPAVDDRNLRSRFKREIQAISALNHPNVVKILDHSMSGEAVYFVMPYLEVVDLEVFWLNLLKGAKKPGPTHLGRAKTLILDVAAGLSHAHQLGVVHRDIKPANILVEARGCRAILSDFGLSRRPDQTPMTAQNAMMGTLSYMSPEAIQGEEMGHASDVYQLGLVSYELVTGELPFAGEGTLEALNRRCTEPIPLASEVNPAVSPDLSDLLVPVLNPDPTKRPSLDEFAQALRTLPMEARARSGRTPGPGTPQRTRVLRRSRRVVPLAVLLSLLVGIALGLVLRRQPNVASPSPAMSSAPSAVPSAIVARRARELQDMVKKLSEAVLGADPDSFLYEFEPEKDPAAAARFVKEKLRSAMALLEQFQPFAKEFHAHPGISIEARIQAYTTLASLIRLEACVKSSGVILSPSPSLSQDGYFSATSEDLFPDRPGLALKLGNVRVIRYDPRGRDAATTVRDAFLDQEHEGALGEMMAMGRLHHPRASAAGQLSLTLKNLRIGTYLQVMVNQKVVLEFLPPPARAPRGFLTVRHTFAPALLKDGMNRFLIAILPMAGVVPADPSVEIVGAELKYR